MLFRLETPKVRALLAIGYRPDVRQEIQMADTKWIDEMFRTEKSDRAAKMTKKEYDLEMRRKWLALAPAFFADIKADIESALDAFNQNLENAGDVRTTSEESRATGSVTYRYKHVLMTIQLRDGDETIACFGDSLPEASFKVVLQNDETFILTRRVYRGRTEDDVEQISRQGAAREIMKPFFTEAVRIS